MGWWYRVWWGGVPGYWVWVPGTGYGYCTGYWDWYCTGYWDWPGLVLGLA